MLSNSDPSFLPFSFSFFLFQAGLKTRVNPSGVNPKTRVNLLNGLLFYCFEGAKSLDAALERLKELLLILTPPPFLCFFFIQAG